jgi:hypothetical protein
MARGGPDKAGTAFLIVWMIFWLAAILVAVWSLGGAAFSGEPVAAVFLAVWVAFALFGLQSAARRVRDQFTGAGGPRRRPHGRHRWNDGIDPPEGPPS